MAKDDEPKKDEARKDEPKKLDKDVHDFLKEADGKGNASQPATQGQAGQSAPQTIYVMPNNPKPAEPIPGFDETVPGGKYVHMGKTVDAHGNEIPEGEDRQDPEVVRRSAQNAADLSRLPIPDTGSGPAK